MADDPPGAVFSNTSADEIRPKLADPLNPHEWDDNGWDFAHVTPLFKVENETFEVDAETGVRKKSIHFEAYRLYRGGRFTAKEMLALYSDASYWNSAFPRHTGESIVRRIIGEFKQRMLAHSEQLDRAA
jgi:hypothetical protein